jgi:hypothetical protein
MPVDPHFLHGVPKGIPRLPQFLSPSPRAEELR